MRYVVPERERQLQIIVDILSRLDRLTTVVELCRGEGLLVEAILDRFPAYAVHGFNGCTKMLR